MNQHHHQRIKQWHDEFSALLVQFAYRFLSTEADAEDAVQDVFARLSQHCPDLEDDEAALKYLFVAVRNRCIDLLRRQQKRGEYEDYMLEHLPPTGDALDEDEETEMLLHEWLQRVSKLIEELPPQNRLIAKARLFHLKTNKEIAKELGISVDTVKNQVSIAIKRLRALLSGGSSSLGLFLVLFLFYLLQVLKTLLVLFQYH